VLIGERPEWHTRAACRGVGTDAFFPERGETTTEARAYCARCEVRDECGAHALTYETHGVWAGQAEKARIRLRRAAGITRIDLQADDDRGGGMSAPTGTPSTT
jgi:WhiB family transcriptional regulator, redox-sensing transcriptional regulator